MQHFQKLFGTLLALFIAIGTIDTAQADSCAFIRESLAKLPANGGEVIVPHGVYVCDSPVILDRDNVSLRGEGNVTLVLKDNANSPVIVMGDVQTPPKLVYGVRVQDIRIDGNRLHQQGECWHGDCDSGGTAFIRNNGITVRGIVDGSIKNVFITGARSGGVVTERGCKNLVIDGLAVTDSHFDGFAGYETSGAVLSHMNLYANKAAGISIDIRFSGNTIRDSHLYRNGDVGIFMRDSNDNKFENLLIEESGSHGIFLAFVEGTSTCPLNNEFLNLTVLRSKGIGFLMNNDCAGNRLVGEAQFRQNRDGCIREPRSGVLGKPTSLICEN